MLFTDLSSGHFDFRIQAPFRLVTVPELINACLGEVFKYPTRLIFYLLPINLH